MASIILDTIETDRLTGERIGRHHLPELMRMHTDPVVMATLNGVKTEAETTAFLEAQLAHWETHGYGIWIIRDRLDGRFVGRAGIRSVHVGGED
jgi:RimJ/RimL family protein N-acetyltransferase